MKTLAPQAIALPPMIDIAGALLAYDKILNAKILNDTENLSRTFSTAAPFPHIVIDGLFSDQLLDLVNDEFDQLREWKRISNQNESHTRSWPGRPLGPAAQIYFDSIHSGRFINFLREVTGIAGLLPDPVLRGGGMHESKNGGRFAPHLDFNKHPVTKLDVRLTMITYLNKDWRSEYGGALELYDTEKRVVAEVEPVFGRTILFYQSPVSFHGHPRPLTMPEGRTRRSVAAYYYSNGVDDAGMEERYTTAFLLPPTQVRKPGLKGTLQHKLRRLRARLGGKA